MNNRLEMAKEEKRNGKWRNAEQEKSNVEDYRECRTWKIIFIKMAGMRKKYEYFR